MRKPDLVEKVADIADIPVRQADDAVSAVFEHVTNALARGESVALVGFGRFTVKKRQARKGRNPQTGEEISIDAKNLVSFSAGKGLKAAVQSTR